MLKLIPAPQMYSKRKLLEFSGFDLIPMHINMHNSCICIQQQKCGTVKFMIKFVWLLNAR